jgi:hypothetical protein
MGCLEERLQRLGAWYRNEKPEAEVYVWNVSEEVGEECGSESRCFLTPQSIAIPNLFVRVTDYISSISKLWPEQVRPNHSPPDVRKDFVVLMRLAEVPTERSVFLWEK